MPIALYQLPDEVEALQALVAGKSVATNDLATLGDRIREAGSDNNRASLWRPAP